MAAVRFPVGEIFGPVRESDRGFLHLPWRLEFLYQVQHGRRVAGKVWSFLGALTAYFTGIPAELLAAPPWVRTRERRPDWAPAGTAKRI